MDSKFTRRDFLKGLAAGAAAAGVLRDEASAAAPLPTRPLGKTGHKASILGFGGGYLDRIEDREAVEVVNRAIDLGINYFDTAPRYGESERRLGLVMKTRRSEVFLATKVNERTKEKAAEQIRASLARLQTDRLDLVQLHGVMTDDEFNQVMGKDGALAALKEAQKAGMVRFIGITGHNPAVLAKAVAAGEFATVLTPVSFVDYFLYDHQSIVLPMAKKHNVGVIIMKPLGAGDKRVLERRVNALRYSLGEDAATVIPGMKSVREVEENVAVAKTFTPLAKEERETLLAQGKELARAIGPYLGPHGAKAIG